MSQCAFGYRDCNRPAGPDGRCEIHQGYCGAYLIPAGRCMRPLKPGHNLCKEHEAAQRGADTRERNRLNAHRERQERMEQRLQREKRLADQLVRECQAGIKTLGLHAELTVNEYDSRVVQLRVDTRTYRIRVEEASEETHGAD